MKNLILEWQKRQQKYEELAEKYKDDAHNNRKFTYKAMATRDCWKELALQLQQTGVMARCFKNYKGQYFIYKSKITKSETKFKVARNFESQGRTVLVSENNNKYYLNEVIPHNEP